MAFVDDHKERFGVEPICRVLTEHGVKIAPNSYYAHKKRPPSMRSVRDERVLAEIVRVHTDPEIGRGLYGVRKVQAALAREGGVDGRPVSRRQVRTPHAQRRPARRPPWQEVHHHPGGPVRAAAAGPGAAGLHRQRAEPAVGGRLHLRADLVRDGVHRVRHRRVLPPHRGMAHRGVHADLTAAGRPGDGVVDPRTRGSHRAGSARRADSSFRCRKSRRNQLVVATSRV